MKKVPTLREAAEIAGKRFETLLNWANNSPSGPSNAHEIAAWVSRRINEGLSALKEALALESQREEARRELVEAGNSWMNYLDECALAKSTGESEYSYKELVEMGNDAKDRLHAALRRVEEVGA